MTAKRRVDGRGTAGGEPRDRSLAARNDEILSRLDAGEELRQVRLTSLNSYYGH
jgi:hypothetical protein